MTAKDAHLPAILEIADDCLVLGHRLSEWCGHAPILEEELALANMGLDLLGQASALYAYAGKLEGKGRSEDDFAFLRREREYVNCLLVERDNRDFAHTCCASSISLPSCNPSGAIAETSSDETLRGIAAKAEKEMAYHLRHSGEWVIRMGDGSDESARRMADAVEELHRYTGELFMASPARAAAVADGLLPDPESLRESGTRPSPPCSTPRNSSCRKSASCRRAAATATMARTWATCWPSCSSCSAPIPA
jgi:ring-1,2-phenylacetyl-CoA epoxidase subunit PaaC